MISTTMMIMTMALMATGADALFSSGLAPPAGPISSAFSFSLEIDSVKVKGSNISQRRRRRRGKETIIHHAKEKKIPTTEKISPKFGIDSAIVFLPSRH